VAFHPHSTLHTREDIANVVSLLARVGISLSEPKNQATWSTISSCITSSNHSDTPHFTILPIMLDRGLLNVFLTCLNQGFVTDLTQGINHQIISKAYSTKPTVLHTHKDNKCIWSSFSFCDNSSSFA
jgi:hypothetical protein